MGSCASIHKSSGPALKLQMSSIIPDEKSEKTTPVIVDSPIKSHSLRFKSQVSPFNSVSSYRSYGGSKDEIFYDSQAWLDSDCEDDFHSVNGDFTPSRNSTPVHSAIGSSRFSRTFSPQVNKALFDGKPPRSASNRSRGSTPLHRSSSASATDQVNGPNLLEGKSPLNPDLSSTTTTTTSKKKKKLADLFRESIRERNGFAFNEDDDNIMSSTSPALPPKSVNGTPSYVSGTNSVSSSGKRTPLSTDDYSGPCQKDKPLKAKAAQCCFPRLVSSRSLRSKDED